MDITDVPHLDAASERLQDHDDHDREYSRRTSSAFQHIPEASRLTWTDSFYDGVPGIIAVFDRDALRAANAYFKSYSCVIAFFLFWALYDVFEFFVHSSPDELKFALVNFVYAVLVGFSAWRGRQNTLTPQHIAVTEQGVRIDDVVRNSFTQRLGFGLPPNNAAVLIPFQHIDLTRHQHQFCCDGDPNLYIVTIYAHGHKQFEIYGIIRAHDFVDLVMAMKESYARNTAAMQLQTSTIKRWNYSSTQHQDQSIA